MEELVSFLLIAMATQPLILRRVLFVGDFLNLYCIPYFCFPTLSSPLASPSVVCIWQRTPRFSFGPFQEDELSPPSGRQKV